jgi:hypothetical protein
MRATSSGNRDLAPHTHVARFRDRVEAEHRDPSTGSERKVISILMGRGLARVVGLSRPDSSPHSAAR